MPPSGISIGLSNAPKLKRPTAPPKPKRPLGAFAAESDGDDDDDAEASVFARAAPKKKGGRPTAVVNAQLATFNALSQKAAEAAAAVEDPSIYDYDGVWDSMKTVDRKKAKAEELDALERKPKYMENLLQSAEIRKRDALRAKEKMLAKEREEEGEEFKDKESFVTGAYKKQQAELLKLEEEERIKEGSHPRVHAREPKLTLPRKP